MSDLMSRAQKIVAAWRAKYVEPELPAMSASETAQLIDHTALKTETTPEMVEKLCQEALEHGFASVCVNSVNVPQCAVALADSDVAVCSVIGFPLGATLTQCKVHEAEACVALGATEIDMVLNVGAMKAGEYALAQRDVAAVAAACHARGAHLKVIFENCLLTDEEKAIASLICVEAGADYIKTSTGFNAGGATVEDVSLMRYAAGPEIGIKAAGGIRDYAKAMAMVAAGATRIGASSGIAIVQGAK